MISFKLKCLPLPEPLHIHSFNFKSSHTVKINTGIVESHTFNWLDWRLPKK